MTPPAPRRSRINRPNVTPVRRRAWRGVRVKTVGVQVLRWVRRSIVAFGVLVLIWGLIGTWPVGTLVRVDTFDPDVPPLYPVEAYKEATVEASLRQLPWVYTKATYPARAISQELSDRYPELSAIQIELPIFGQRPMVRARVERPLAWFESPPNPPVIVDRQGTAIWVSQPDQLLPEWYQTLPRIKDDVPSDQPIALGDSVISSETADFIEGITVIARENRLQIERITLPSTPFEIRVRIVDEPYDVRFYTAGEVRDQGGSWLAARATLSSRGVKPAQYLDVRSQEKVYWQ